MPFTEHFVTAADGTRLYARDYGPPGSPLTPAICLPGFSRNSRDFETLAPRLAETRRVVTIDFRGRGRSGRADPATYRPDQEVADTLAVIDRLGIARFAVIGTSRGGIAAMVMAARAMPRMAGVLFNDIGPRAETAGLLRIRGYLGEDRTVSTWEQAVAAVKAANPGFPGLSEAQWLAFAQRLFREEAGVLRADYDPALAATFPSASDIEAGKVPELWKLAGLLANVPALVVRGENSDILSAATVTAMHAHLRRLDSVTVKNRGHVPFLDEPESLAAIDRWLAAVDKG
ncbi:MAG: alpha/beta fold hydrolase [Aestuariivirga sp.]|uniref:alpha/beta fold hydrolase n=1 Tax=Aestuariivirga sp. TaxID=2650926 RepID=UPI0038CFBA16